MNKVAIFALILSLFSAGTGLLVALFVCHHSISRHRCGLVIAEPVLGDDIFGCAALAQCTDDLVVRRIEVIGVD